MRHLGLKDVPDAAIDGLFTSFDKDGSGVLE